MIALRTGGLVSGQHGHGGTVQLHMSWSVPESIVECNDCRLDRIVPWKCRIELTNSIANAMMHLPSL